MSTQDTAGAAREGMTMSDETTRLRALLERTAARVLTVAEERDAATKRAERAERERDDLAATLETRTAEHALAMARVRELEARTAEHATPPTDEERLRKHAADALDMAEWEEEQGFWQSAEASRRAAAHYTALADGAPTAEVSRAD